MSISRWAILTALAALMAASGCTSKRREEGKQGGQVQSGTEIAPPVVTDSIREPGGTTRTAPSAPVTDLFSRIHEHESQISQIISSGQLNEVEREALAIRDLLVAVAGRASVPADQKGAFEERVEGTKYAISALIKAAKSGNLNETQAQNAMLQKELGAVERIVVSPGP